MKNTTTVFLFAGLFVAACSAPAQKAASDPAQKPPSAGTIPHTPMGALPDIDSDAVLAHIKTLSSDELRARGPGTRGEKLTVNYLIDQFKRIGATPGNTDGTYIQKVPLVGITPTP